MSCRSLAMGLAVLAVLVLAARPNVARAATVREAVDSLLPKLGGPKPPGDVLFEEDFESGKLDRWRAGGGWSVVDRPDGQGKCAHVVSAEKNHEDLILVPKVPVTPGHPIAVFFRVRAISGTSPLFLRVDFFDENGKTGDPYARQQESRETGEWTDNALLVSDWFPAYTRSITIHFHHVPGANTVSLLDGVRVVDLAGAAGDIVARELPDAVEGLKRLAADADSLRKSPLNDAWKAAVAAALPRLRGELDAAAKLEAGSPAFEQALARPATTVKRLSEAVAALKKGELGTSQVLVYRTRAVTSQMVLPYSADLPGAIAREVALEACPGQFESASLVLWGPEALAGLSVAAHDLRGPGGAIPAANVDLKWVKCWFQAGSAPHGIGQDRSHKVLVPELLVNDDTLAKVDLDGQHEFLKLSFPDGPKYVPIDDPKDVPWGWKATLQEFPVRDSATLLPLDLPAGQNKQVWITVKTPAGLKPGTYTGPISVSLAGKKIGEVSLTVRVLPFTLEEPRTHYDPSAGLTYSLYYWGELDPTGAGTIGFKVKSEEQFRAELRHMYDHGIVAPAMIWSPDIVYRNEPLFRKHLEIAKETGMSGRPLYFADSGMIGAPTDPVEITALQANVKKTIRIAAEYGFTGVYFYGLDEATGDRLAAQRAAWKAVHEAGGKIIVSGFRGQLEAVGDILDLFNWAGPLDPAQPPEWHKRGHKIWNYANPQTPVEDPEVYRRNYGLLLWKTDYDGACTYCYMDSSGTPWNDFDCDSYRDHNVAYPTVNGVVYTLALEGFREGADDVKCATTLRVAADRAQKTGTPEQKAKADKALAWLESVNPTTADLDATRAEMVRLILDLRGGTR